jgi:predicted nucleic acid-binding protein
VTGYLIDTNAISEYTRPAPHPKVMHWFSLTDPNLLFASVITVGEIRIGIENLPLGRRRTDFETWLQSGMPQWFAPNLLPVSPAIADRWGRLTMLAKRNGTPLAAADGLIAATALEHGLTLVTRNSGDFASLPIDLFNPWIS